VMNSPVLASPIKQLDASPVTDGCCAVLMASESAVRRFNLKPAWIRGVGFSTDSYYPGHRDLTEIRSAHLAAERAYRMAGIKEPSKEIHTAELHEAFSFQELMLYEALGLCEKGRGGELLQSGDSDFDARGLFPVNLSGGALSANPIFATGLIRLAESAKQVTGQAEGLSIESKTALAHATSGFCLQSNIVYVLGAE
jgi:acetyl-CoA C-acetyltransferase